MRICFIGPSNSAHIIKWCTWFAENNHEVHVISFSPDNIPNVQVRYIDSGTDTKGGDFSKLRYMLTGGKIRKEVDKIKPDVINVHYATSYGIATALSGIKGYYLSVWGSDVYSFPKKSIFHRALVKYSLKKASYLFSTSQAMADEAHKYTDKEIMITPFGIDMKLFEPGKRTRGNDSSFVVGTVKALAPAYGIEYILEAVSAINKRGDIPIQLRIAGKGAQEQHYRDMAKELGIEHITTWLGFISQEQAATEWANMDVAVIPSVSESFGVAAIEAQACGTPVIVSDAPGLLETTKPNETSIVVKRNESEQIVSALYKLYQNKELRDKMRANGVAFVREQFELNYCFRRIQNIYEKNSMR